MQVNGEPEDSNEFESEEWEFEEWASDLARHEGQSSRADQRSQEPYDDFENYVRNDLERGEKLRVALAELAHSIIEVTKVIIPLSVVVLSWHFMLPKWLGWLTEEQLQGLLTFLGSIFFLGLLGTVYTFVRRQLKRAL